MRAGGIKTAGVGWESARKCGLVQADQRQHWVARQVFPTQGQVAQARLVDFSESVFVVVFTSRRYFSCHLVLAEDLHARAVCPVRPGCEEKEHPEWAGGRSGPRPNPVLYGAAWTGSRRGACVLPGCAALLSPPTGRRLRQTKSARLRAGGLSTRQAGGHETSRTAAPA